MSLETYISSISVTNNKFGAFTAAGFALYAYDNGPIINGSAFIEKNYFAILDANSSIDMLTIKDGSCIIRDNKFLKAANINSYINHTGTGDQIITNNIFNDSTTDGTDEILVKGLSVTSIYHTNKNQIYYVPISLFNSINTVKISTGDYFSETVGVTTGSQSPLDGYRPYIDVVVPVQGGTSAYYNFLITLNSVLPINIKILSLKIGLFDPNNGFQPTTNATFHMNLLSEAPLTANYASGTNSILDVQNNRFLQNEFITTSYDLHANDTAIRTTTQYLTLTAGSNNFIVNESNMISFNISIRFVEVSGESRGGDMTVSPIVLKCMW